MASASKVAANRRNAAKSTGPRNEAAKARTRRNAQRHGLAAQTAFDADHAVRIETLAREIEGAASDLISINAARVIAQAELDLERVRAIKVGLINGAALPAMKALSTGWPQPEHLAAAIRQVLPELVKIDRYERRAAARRDRAVRDLILAARARYQTHSFWQNKAKL